MAVILRIGVKGKSAVDLGQEIKGREVIRRDLYEDYASSNVVDFAPIVETSGRIIDDDLPEIARLFVKEYKD